MFKSFRNLAFSAAALLACSSAHAVVVWDTSVDHSSNIGTAASLLATNLGGVGTATFSGSSSAGWATMAGTLGAGDVLLLGQSSDTFNTDLATRNAISNFVNSGGVLLQLWGPHMDLFNHVTGASVTSGLTVSSGSTFTKTAAAAGTSFDSAPATLASASNHGGIAVGSLAGGISIYENATNTVSHVAVYSIGAGTVGFLSWDWCCGDGVGVRAAWDQALFSAATFRGTPVPEPASLLLLGIGLVGLRAARRQPS